MKPGYYLLLIAAAGVIGSVLTPWWLNAFNSGQTGRGLVFLVLNILVIGVLMVMGWRLARKD